MSEARRARGWVSHLSLSPDLRRLAAWGSTKGPRWLVEHSPGPIGVVAGLAFAEARRRVLRNRGLLGLSTRGVAAELAATRTLAAYGHCLAEGFGLQRPEGLAAEVSWADGEGAEVLYDGKSGAVVVTAHFGAWDLGAQLLARRTGRTVTVVMEAEPGKAGAVHDAHRERSGVRLHHVGSALGTLELLPILREGGIVALQLDRVAAGSRRVSFALPGGVLSLPEGPFRLAAAAGVPLVLVLFERKGYFSYAVHAGPVLALPRRLSPEDLRAAADALGQRLLFHLSRNPTQWFHFGPDATADGQPQ